MAVENLTATRRGVKAAGAQGIGKTVKATVATVEASAGSSVGSTYSFGNIPNDARILGMSKLLYDALTAGAVKLGLFAVDGNITSDDDALLGATSAASAGSTNVVSDIANYGKKAWEFVSGQTTEPGGEFEVKATVTTAFTAGGTLALELYWTLD